MSSDAAIWHDVECGAYRADLALWRELAQRSSAVSSASRPGVAGVLELGCGTGRVAFELGRAGFEVVGVERDLELAAEFELRAGGAALRVQAHLADLTSLELGRRFGLVLAPMQLIQLLPASERPIALAAIHRHLEPGGIAALAIIEPGSLAGAGAEAPLPDMRELDGIVYSSRPLWVETGEGELVVKRLRERVAKDGEIETSVHEDHMAILDADELEREAAATGLEPRGRRSIENGPGEAGSTVVILERP